MDKVKVKMEIEFWYDPVNDTYEPISSKKIDTTKTESIRSRKSKSVISNDEALLVLYDNKYEFNELAIELLDISPDDKISIKYQKINKVITPVIGKDDTFGTKGGNKLTKSNTVSFRGKNNDKLSEFGSEFRLISIDDSGIFKLISTDDNDDVKYVVRDNNIDIKESDDFNIGTLDDDDYNITESEDLDDDRDIDRSNVDSFFDDDDDDDTQEISFSEIL